MQKIKQLLKNAEIHKVKLKSLLHTVNLQMWYANRLPDLKTTLGGKKYKTANFLVALTRA